MNKLNFTKNSSGDASSCEFGRGQNVSLATIELVTFLVGQPVISRLLWITLTSKKDKDVLNVNLALFHVLQYIVSVAHVIVMFVKPEVQMSFISFYIVYAELGGPLNLSLICMQRYVAVLHPTSYPQLKKYRCREIWATAVWLLCLPMALASTIQPSSAISSMKDDMINTVSFTVTISIAVLIARFTAKIAVTLQRSGPGGERLSPAKRRAFTTVCATSVITLCFYTSVALLQKFKNVDEYAYECVVTPVCVVLLSAASIVHPLFYLSTQRDADKNAL